MADILYTYGTLRPGNTEPVMVPGILYDLGWFPGIKLQDHNNAGSWVACERVEVEDWDRLDSYEGYSSKYPEDSLFVRKPFLDGYIYEFNRQITPVKQVFSGDWLEYTGKERGLYGQGR